MAVVSEVVAASRDGRSFTFWSQGSPGVGAGDMVVVQVPGGVTVLGQVLDVTGPSHGPGQRSAETGATAGSAIWSTNTCSTALSPANRGPIASITSSPTRCGERSSSSPPWR